MPYQQEHKNNEQKNLETILVEKVKFHKTGLDPITAAFVLALSCKQKNITIRDIINNDFVKESTLKYRIKSMLTTEILKELQESLKAYSYEDFVNFILHYNEGNNFRQNMSTPDCLIKLAIKLLDISPSDKIGDFGCGQGNFLIQSSAQYPQNKYYGYDIDTNSIEIAKIRSLFSKTDINIKQSNIFNIQEEKFNKIFANYPFAFPLRHLGEGLEYIKTLQNRCTKFSTATSSDWIFNSFICDSLTDNGKGIGIMTNGSTWNTIDAPIRKYFVENGLIEAIIALPSKLFFNTAISTCLILLSKNNKTIRMIDASNLYKEERRQNVITDQDIQKILNAYKEDSDYSRKVSLEELQKQNYNLFPGKYLKQEIVIENSVPLDSLADNITRAAALTAQELDLLISSTPTDIQYLIASDINKGILSNELHFLKELPEKCKGAIIEDNSLVLTKNAPYKIAVVRVPKGKKIVANGNMYIIKLNSDKANSFYIQTFLESELGQKVLEQASVGTVISNLSLQAVKNLPIPIKPIKIQNEIAQRYLCAQDEVSILRLRLSQAEKKLQNIWQDTQEII